MNLRDIKVDAEVAVLDSPSKRSVRTDVPRQARVIEIVTTAKSRRSGYGYGPSKNVNVKQIKIELLDTKQRDSRYGHSWDRIASAEKGEQIVVETRQVIGTWDELGGAALKKAEYRQQAAALREDLEKRLDALLSSEDGSRFSVTMRESFVSYDSNERKPEPYANISGDMLIHLIELAEKGAKS